MTPEHEVNQQTAPYPHELADLVSKCSYRPHWHLRLVDDYDRGQGCSGLTLIITVDTQDTYEPHGPVRVLHLFPVPPAAYNRESWASWLMESVLLVEQHEAMEWLVIDGVRPYAPNHGPGWNPYLITVVANDVARRTSFLGEIEPA